jgi:tetratricopeptide (TPR) repeat protein
VLKLREKYLPPESIDIAASLNNLAAALHSAGRNAEADPLLRRGLLIAENAHDDKITASVLNTLGLVLMTLGERARAEPVLRRAEALFEKVGGPDSFDAAKTANNLATLYAQQGEFVKAEKQERRALPIYEKNLPPDHHLMGVVTNNMFSILGAEKRFDEAETYLRRALVIAERSPGGIGVQQIRANQAALEAERGNWKIAADILEQVIAAEERLLGPQHPLLITALANYSEALKHLHHKAEAKQAERRALAIMNAFRP